MMNKPPLIICNHFSLMTILVVFQEEEPLNSEDDVTDDEEQADLFDTDNVVVCQYDKVLIN